MDALPPPVTDKKDMYARLAAGYFGNTLVQWFDWRLWAADKSWPLANPGGEETLWAVRSMEPGGPFRKDLSAGEAARECQRREAARLPYSVQPMIHRWATPVLMCNVFEEAGTGLVAEGAIRFDPLRDNYWRGPLSSRPQTWIRSVAGAVLRQFLNDQSYSDLADVLRLYPGHVVELTAFQDVRGGWLFTVPGRNAVVWEVRSGY